MNNNQHPFVKEGIIAIERDGYPEVLYQMVSTLKNQDIYATLSSNASWDSQCLSVTFNGGLGTSYEGVVERGSSVIMEVKIGRVIEVDVEKRVIVRVNHEMVSGIEHNQVLDLNDDGERWEGDVLQNKPYGWGVLYDAEGCKVYEGFRIGDVSVCYGTQYYSDLEKIEYRGEIFEGKRWGRGLQYDRNGRIVVDGKWLNNNPPEKRIVVTRDSEDNLLLHTLLEEFIVCDSCCNGKEWKFLDLSPLINLKRLQVGNSCFQQVEEFKLTRMNNLERIEIGKESFCEITDYKNPNLHFYLKKCERLRELTIDQNSFHDYTVCEIEDVPSLEVIKMESLNFRYVSHFELKGVLAL